MSETAQQSFQVGAYFYPLTTVCTDRSYRAGKVGDALEHPKILSPPDEFAVIKDAPSLFEGHDQPRVYTLDGKHTTWDDFRGLTEQIGLAHRAGLSYFIFDAYTGMKKGEAYTELTAPLDQLLKLAELRRELQFPTQLDVVDFHYARMETLESPRVLMPMPPTGDGSIFAEPIRSYDISAESARFIVDENVPHWRSPYYLRVNGWPYLSILMPNFGGAPEVVRMQKMHELISTIRDYALRKYDIAPYLVGVIRSPGDAERWINLQADAITHYANLPQFGPDAPPIQDYATTAQIRREDWPRLHRLGDHLGTPFIPAPSVGWDASPRGERGHTWEEVAGKAPYTPIVVDSTPERVSEHLRASIDFARANLFPYQRLLTMFAWNEIGEGAALVPRLRPDGTVDRSLLEAVHQTIQTARHAGAVATASAVKHNPHRTDANSKLSNYGIIS